MELVAFGIFVGIVFFACLDMDADIRHVRRELRRRN